MSGDSLAGTWGLKKKELGLTAKVESMTMSKYSFGDQHIKEYQQKQKHQFAKFSNMKESKNMILKYKDTNVHFEESVSGYGEGVGSLDASLEEPSNAIVLTRIMALLRLVWRALAKLSYLLTMLQLLWAGLDIEWRKV